jgi:ferredoxin-NADP reductase
LFTLEPTDGHRLDYVSGQYITLVEHEGLEEVRRSYSMTSAPILQEPLTIGVKRLENGSFSRLLFRLKTGSIIKATGSGGFFALPENISAGRKFFFLAAGAGITPVFSIIKTALALHPDISVTLIYSNHSPAHTVFFQELSGLAQANNNFRVEFLFSNNADLARARLSPELLFQLLDEYHADATNGLFYICGPESYMRMCVFALREAGVADEQIRKENFIVRKKELSYNIPPDQQPHEVIIEVNGQMTALKVQYPVSILETAKRSGLALPYSCQSGVCGNCVARCISGAIWMSNNEVLTASELKEQLVLTCTGFPVFGDVLLKII